jgi:succinyl-diaminopimelate desuccinylase
VTIVPIASPSEAEWLQAAADLEEAAALTARLVAVRSYPGEEGAVQRLIAAWLDAHGLTAELQVTEGDRPNVLARVSNGPGPTLLLNGHSDTVLAADGWSCDPWQGRRDGGRLLGLGACDMKAGLAAMLLAARALARRRDLWSGTLLVSSVVDEEALSVGARALLTTGLQADACVVLESAWQQPAIGSVGKVLARVDVTGKATHASWPARGVNAAVELARLVARLNELPLGEHPRLTASQAVLSLHSGSQQYVITVPEHARCLINRMIVPGEDGASVVAQLRALADSLDSPAQFEINIDPPYYPPWEMAPDTPFVRQFADAYAAEVGVPPSFGYTGFGDANLFAHELGAPTVHFGPHGGQFHEADEWVELASIPASARVLLRLATAFMPPTADSSA